MSLKCGEEDDKKIKWGPQLYWNLQIFNFAILSRKVMSDPKILMVICLRIPQ